MKYAQIRICEWTAGIQQFGDPTTGLRMANGGTFLEMEDDEKLSHVEVMTTGKSFHVPMQDENGKSVNVPHTTYAFRATLVKAVSEEIVQAAADAEEAQEAAQPQHAVVLPGQANRAERRAAASAKGRPKDGYKPTGK